MEVAEYLKSINTYEGQRPFKAAKLMILIQKQMEGKFHVGFICIAILGYKNNLRVLFNGQHQAAMIIATGIPISALVIEVYCSNEMEASLLYQQFDTDSRTLRDMARAGKEGIGVDWTDRVCSLLISGAVIKENLFAATKDRKVELMEEYIPEGDFLHVLLGKGKTGRHLEKAAVICAIIDTFEANPEEAVMFWLEARDGEKLTMKDATWTVREYLRTVKLGQGTRSGGDKKLVTTDEVRHKIYVAWNAFMKDEPTQLKIYNKEKGFPTLLTKRTKKRNNGK